MSNLSKQIKLRIEPDLKRSLDEIARADPMGDQTLSDVVRRILRTHIIEETNKLQETPNYGRKK
jgi:hypothetical protein